ncbi:MAG: phosphopyruvate hydratase [Candidatus Shapirobacteria bacterium]|nr:phosphopyruvate hydratase [Candidatus Shapirobacteria bacterium]
MAKIKKIEAREILASGGAPTIEATVTLETGIVGEASVSYGASAGSKEAFLMLDGDKARYNGKGMLNAIENIKDVIAPVLMGQEGQQNIDKLMIELDGTENKSKLGGNAILAVSMAYARAAASDAGKQLYEYLGEIYSLDKFNKLPKPMVVMIEGGKHADQTTDLQEYLISSLGNRSASENVRVQMEIYEALKKILKREGLSINVGNEGAFAPNGITSNEKPMEYLVEAIKNAGYIPGVDVGISIDAAASEFYDLRNKIYDLRIEQRKLNSEELINYYLSWIDKYPFVSWEDMLSEFDWESWPTLSNRVKISGGNFKVIADDLTATNTKLLQRAIDEKAATAILIKLNQAGTVTETIECCKKARANNFWTVVSHRGGGESNDTFMVDVAVAVGSEYIKCGPTRGERVAKYNRLMRIEENLK